MTILSRRLAVSSLALALLTACVPLQPAPGAPDLRAAASGTCHAAPVQWAVGEHATETVMGRVWRESHAGLIRPVKPGQAVTLDVRADRVNVELDADNRIVRIHCG